MPKVYNRHHGNAPADAVYVGRGSEWGNPFRIGEDGSREVVLAKFKAMLYGDPLLLKRVKQRLQGKDLVCFCAPLACHADILLEVANACC